MDEPFYDSLLPAGTTLKQTYELIRVLGEGGAGAVYEGRHIDLGNPVAIKVLFSELARMPQIRERFVEEGRIQANLRHPNLVAVNDIVEEGSLVAIVMEYVEGETLHHFIQRQTDTIPVEKAVGIVLRVLAGLDVAHSASIVHRDIKPGNILLAATELGMVPKLCDFGIAKVDSNRSLTVSGTKMGTLHYMAPEQFQDARTVDPGADIYSLGITFYELLTGHLPFDSDNEYALMRAHLDIKPPSPSGYRPGLPDQLNDLVLRCMEKRPEDRYASAREMADALLEIPEFRRMADYRSSPTVSDVVQSLHVTAMGAPEHFVRSHKAQDGRRGTTTHPHRPLDRAKRRAKAVKSSAQGKTGKITAFPLFLGGFAALLILVVVLWIFNQNGKTPASAPLPVVVDPKPTQPVVAPQPEADLADSEEVEPMAVAPNCYELGDQVAVYVFAGDLSLPAELGGYLEDTADSCVDTFREYIDDNAFDVTYSRVRGDILIIGRNLYRLGTVTEDENRCLIFLRTDGAYTSSVARLDLALDGGEVSGFDAIRLREQRDSLVQGRLTLRSLYGNCEP